MHRIPSSNSRYVDCFRDVHNLGVSSKKATRLSPLTFTGTSSTMTFVIRVPIYYPSVDGLSFSSWFLPLTSWHPFLQPVRYSIMHSIFCPECCFQSWRSSMLDSSFPCWPESISDMQGRRSAGRLFSSVRHLSLQELWGTHSFSCF